MFEINFGTGSTVPERLRNAFQKPTKHVKLSGLVIVTDVLSAAYVA
jgi:hypothetical protein